MESKKAIERCIGHHVVAPNPDRQLRSNKRNGGEQIYDDLRTPEGHLAPGQEVAEKGFGHQAQENTDAKNPDEFAWFAVGAVNQRTSHVKVDNDKKHRCACRVHVADEPSARDFAHDVFDRLECVLGVGLVVHDKENSRHDLQH